MDGLSSVERRIKKRIREIKAQNARDSGEVGYRSPVEWSRAPELGVERNSGTKIIIRDIDNDYLGTSSLAALYHPKLLGQHRVNLFVNRSI